MRFSTIVAVAAPFVGLACAESTTEPGYAVVPSTVTSNTFDFGSNYAVLNLDCINGLVDAVEGTTSGNAWIASVQKWINAVHAKSSHPLQIFTRIYFSPGHPEVATTDPFYTPAESLINNTQFVGNSSDLYFAANPFGYANGTSKDVVLQKTRYDATIGNQMLEILYSQNIDTVILSGIRTSGVILSTAYTLFDLNFNVYVISNNSIEMASDVPNIDLAIKAGILPKLPVNIINIDQAIAALGRSS